MANSTIQTIMEKMESKINAQKTGAGTLSFMAASSERVAITDQAPEDGRREPYRRYRITIYPNQAQSVADTNKIGNRVERDYAIMVTCDRKATKKGKFRIFSDSNDTERGVGIYEMVNRVMDILRHNTLDGTINPQGREFDQPSFEGDTEFSERMTFTFFANVLATVTASGVN